MITNSNKEASQKKPFLVGPSLLGACSVLAGENLPASILLSDIVLRSDSKTLKDEKGVSGWICLSRNQWGYATNLTRHQLDNAIAKLKKSMLIETRRRRLFRSDPAALIWLRLATGTKSALTEIKSRPQISAFSEIPTFAHSVNAENSEGISSVISESLDVNEEKEKEENFKNVVIEKTTMPAVHVEKKKSQKGKKGWVQLNGVEWFNVTISKIYKDSNYTFDAYSEAQGKRLKTLMTYLESNPGTYFSSCPEESDPMIYALNSAVKNWPGFTNFAANRCGAFNMPNVPQLWALEKQSKAIVDFAKLHNYGQQLEQNFIAAGLKAHHCEDLKTNLDEFDKFILLKSYERQKFFEKHISNCGPSPATLKLMAMKEKNKLSY